MNLDKAPRILTDFIRHVSEKSIMRSIRIHISSIHPEYHYKNTDLEFISPYHVLMIYFSAAQPSSYSNPDDGSQEFAERCDFDQESFNQLVPKERALEKFRAMEVLMTY